jgi:hypothetical protein
LCAEQLASLQALEVRASDLERDVIVKDARFKTMQEALQLQEADTLRLQQQLADASQEVSAARTRVAASERRAHDAHELASRQAVEARAQGSLQKAQLLARVSKSESLQHVRTSQMLLVCCEPVLPSLGLKVVNIIPGSGLRINNLLDCVAVASTQHVLHDFAC